METNNLPPFYVGQKVVQLVDGVFTKTKKGDVYTVKELLRFPCGCWTVDVGIKSTKPKVACNLHNDSREFTNGIRWVNSMFLAPIEENFQSISYSKILEEENKLISVN